MAANNQMLASLSPRVYVGAPARYRTVTGGLDVAALADWDSITLGPCTCSMRLQRSRRLRLSLPFLETWMTLRMNELVVHISDENLDPTNKLFCAV
jgi:hypothetical protein